jgi:hypothetical protein
MSDKKVDKKDEPSDEQILTAIAKESKEWDKVRRSFLSCASASS